MISSTRPRRSGWESSRLVTSSDTSDPGLTLTDRKQSGGRSSRAAIIRVSTVASKSGPYPYRAAAANHSAGPASSSLRKRASAS